MRMRKLFASLAAAATLLAGGLTAVAANAAPDEGDTGTGSTMQATFTFQAATKDQLEHVTLTAYKIGDYETIPGETNKWTAVANQANKTIVNQVLNAQFTGDQYNDKPTDDNADLLAWALQKGYLDMSANRPWDEAMSGAASATRAFANSLATKTGDDSNPKLTAKQENIKFTSGNISDVQNGQGDRKYQATVSLEPGIYLFTGVSDSDTITAPVPIVIGSGTLDNGVITDLNGNPVVDLKNSKNEKPTKTDNKNGVSIGDTMTYTITGKVSNPAPSSFWFTDKPGKGLTVKLDTIKVTVPGETEGAITTLNKTTDYTVQCSTDSGKNFADCSGETLDGAENSQNQFKVTINTPSTYAGKTLTLTYDATVNDQADVENGVVNDIDNPGGTDQDKDVFHGFDFTKVNHDGQGINGAEFQVYPANAEGTGKADNAQPYWFVKQADGTWRKAAGQDSGTTDNPATQTITSNTVDTKDGVVKVTGLGEGKYYVEETAVASSEYLSGYKASFIVDVKIDKKTDGSYDKSFTITAVGDHKSLVSTTDGKTTVLNIRDISELPETGAAGIALFVVLGVLLAGVAVTLLMRGQRIRRQLA